MTSWLRRALGWTTVVVSGSGLAYLWMRYFLASDDPFAVVNHPLEPWMLDLHVLASPVLIALFGMTIALHILPKLQQPGRARRTGLVSLGSFAAASASGYLLQVTTAPGWSTVWLVVHVAGGGVFAAGYLAHVMTGAASSGRQAALDRPPRKAA